ncbi:hypothetical protein FQA47_014162 [Oryzias melastigma]|uniref:Secreted protein n=1 Tax=Oryzias melastigma TaxID=30732 RepID=A0A834BVR9_ORYME|nr:hypothetical protein FQA47_014162 [Oryzias melastigma]
MAATQTILFVLRLVSCSGTTITATFTTPDEILKSQSVLSKFTACFLIIVSNKENAVCSTHEFTTSDQASSWSPSDCPSQLLPPGVSSETRSVPAASFVLRSTHKTSSYWP